MTETTALMRALDVSPADLESNRAGRLSDRQQAQIRRRRGRLLLIGGAVTLVCAVIAALFLQLGRRDESLLLTAIGIGVTLLNALLVGVLAQQGLRLTADLQDGQVKRVCGEVRLTVRVVARRATLYIVQAGNPADPAQYIEAAVSLAAFESLRERRDYCLYTLPRTGALLSGE